VPVDRLVPFAGNPRKISQSGLAKLQRSVTDFGFVNPILAQRGTNMIIAGHQRLKAAQAAGLTEVPVVWLDMDDVTAKAYSIADNRLQDEAEWDFEPLTDLLTELDTGAFDLTLTGFGSQELEDIMSYCHLPEVVDYSEHEDDRGNRTAPGKGKMVVSVGTMSALVDYEVVQAMMSRIEARWGNGDEGVNAFCQWFISE
ncbi:MAG: ParB/Srx family N-terminal domain-containing protein, partial [Bacillota bacterium]